MRRPDPAFGSGAGWCGQSRPRANPQSAGGAPRANHLAPIWRLLFPIQQEGSRDLTCPFGPSGGEFLTARMHPCTARARKPAGLAFIDSALMMLQSPMAPLPAVALDIGLCAECHVDRSASNEAILPAITMKNSGGFPEHGRSPGQRI